MKNILLIAFIAMTFCFTSVSQADHKPNQQPPRSRRPIIINIGGINIEIGTKRNGRRGVRVDVPQGGVHVDIDSDNARRGAGGVHVTQNGMTFWGDGTLPLSPVAPPLPESPGSNIELGDPAGSDEPFDLDAPVEEEPVKKRTGKPQIGVPPAPTTSDDVPPAPSTTIIRQRKS